MDKLSNKLLITLLFTTFVISLSSCGSAIISPIDGVQKASKYDKYMYQCEGEANKDICLQRYNQIILKKRPLAQAGIKSPAKRPQARTAPRIPANDVVNPQTTPPPTLIRRSNTLYRF